MPSFRMPSFHAAATNDRRIRSIARLEIPYLDELDLAKGSPGQ